jgi:hypothetical protein
LSVPDYTSPYETAKIDAVPPAATTLARTPVALQNITEDQTRQVELDAGVTFSGVLLGEGGAPLPNVGIHVGKEVVYTNAAGAFSVSTAPGTYTFSISGSRAAGISHAEAPSYFDFYEGEVTLTTNVNENLRLPVHAVVVRTVGPGGSPIAGVAFEETLTSISLGHAVSLAPGVTVNYADIYEAETTNASGEATLSVPDYTSPYETAKIDAVPPAATTLARTPVALQNITEDQTRLLVFGRSATDTTPPTINCASPDSTWHANNVSIACAASDSITGLANPEDASFTLTTNVASGEATEAAYTNSVRVCNKADNCANAGPIGPIKIDRQPPSISITQPAEGQLIAQGSSVSAQYSCSDEGSGVASCEGSVANGHALETSTPGQYTFSVSATDAVGNQTTRTVHYTVAALGGCSLAVLCQVGLGDITPPEVVGLTVEPLTVNTSSSAQEVEVVVHATDNLSGTAAVEVNLSNGTHWFSAPAQLAPSESGLDGEWTAKVTLPAYSAPGHYAISVGVIDAAGNSRTYSAAELGAMGLPNSVLQEGSGTTTPPALLGLSVSGATVSTCTEAKAVTAVVEATDTESGVASVDMVLTGPSGQHVVSPATLVSGNDHQGRWSATLTIPAYAQSGPWLISVQSTDNAGNTQYLSAAQLSGLGLPYEVTQTCSGDILPPVVTGLTLSPTSIDTEEEAQSVTVAVNATDNLSGVARLQATLTSGSQHLSAPATLQPGGSSLSGVWLATLTLPRWSRQGTWQLSLEAADAVGNTVSLSAAQLATMGLPNSITQTGIGDITPPTLVSGYVEPNTINTAKASAQVHVHMNITDAQSGTAGVLVRFISPHGHEVAGAATLESGTAHDGNWVAALTFPRYSEQGGWQIEVEVWDAIGNHRIYTSLELESLGFKPVNLGPPPTVSAVTPNTGPTSGSTTVTIIGANFTGATAVEFGTHAAQSFTVVSETEITAVSPREGASTVDVTVETPDGVSETSAADHFTFARVAVTSQPPQLLVNGYRRPAIGTCPREATGGCEPSEQRSVASVAEPTLGWGQVTLHAAGLGAAGVQCATTSTGKLWNEHEHGNVADPIRAYGLIEAWGTSSCTASELLSSKERQGGGEPLSVFVTAEPPLQQQYVQAEVCRGMSHGRGSRLTECTEPSERETTELAASVQRRTSTLPWRTEVLRGTGHGGEDVVLQRTGMAAYGECGPGDPEATAGNPVKCRAREGDSKCFPASQRATELPSGCVGLDVVIPQIPIELPVYGSVEALWQNGEGSGADPSDTAFEPQWYGTLTDELGSERGYISGEEKVLGEEGQSLITMR